MAFEPRRDHDAEEETQARGDCCEAAPGGCAGVAGAERCRGGTLDWGYGGHVLPLAPGVWRDTHRGPINNLCERRDSRARFRAACEVARGTTRVAASACFGSTI